MFDVVIRGAEVVCPQATMRADVAIEGQQIAAIELELPGGRREMDATGMVLLPGVIDSHVHFNEPGRTDWEGAATGSRALAAGGGTLFFDMPLNSSPCTVGAVGFQAKRAALEAASITDFALWGGLVPGNRGQLEELAQHGVVGFKAFLCDSGLPEFPRADDQTLCEGMLTAARLRLPVAVHAENEEITGALSRRVRNQGRRDVQAFLESRPVLAEVEAIERAALFARETGCKLHIVHVSSGRGVVAAVEARSRGADITIETCPHYLFFTDDDLQRLGAVAKCAPPLRNHEERERLWEVVLRGWVDTIGSDHSPCDPHLKQCDDFFEIWGGIAGVQSTLAVLLEEGHHRRGLSLSRISDMLSAKPADRFGIAGKGRIEPGLDADVTLVNLTVPNRVTQGSLLQRHAISPYIGSEFRAHVYATIRRGELIFHEGAIVTQTHGSLVRPRTIQ